MYVLVTLFNFLTCLHISYRRKVNIWCSNGWLSCCYVVNEAFIVQPMSLYIYRHNTCVYQAHAFLHVFWTLNLVMLLKLRISNSLSWFCFQNQYSVTSRSHRNYNSYTMVYTFQHCGLVPCMPIGVFVRSLYLLKVFLYLVKVYNPIYMWSWITTVCRSTCADSWDCQECQRGMLPQLAWVINEKLYTQSFYVVKILKISHHKLESNGPSLLILTACAHCAQAKGTHFCWIPLLSNGRFKITNCKLHEASNNISNVYTTTSCIYESLWEQIRILLNRKC